MTNGEKYKTAQERYDVFLAWCDQHGANCHKDADFSALECAKCQFAWLDLEYEVEKPLPCPFCGGEAIVRAIWNCTFRVECNTDGCWYSSKCEKSKSEAVAAHNRVAKAVSSGNNTIKCIRN